MLNERVPTKFEMTFSKSVISAPLPRFPEAQLSSAMDGDFINAGASLEWQLRAHGVSHSALHHSFHPLSCEPCNKCICLPVAVEWNRHRLRLPVANNLQCNRKQLNLHITHDHRQFADSALASTSLIGSPVPFHALLLHEQWCLRLWQGWGPDQNIDCCSARTRHRMPDGSLMSRAAPSSKLEAPNSWL